MANNGIDNAREHLLGAMLLGTAGYIEHQEKQGQQEIVASTVKLPKQGDWAKLLTMGFSKGVDIDNLFCFASMPDGWQMVATDHSMWTDIVDERGLKRASMFYKAAFYDRDAFIRVNDRFRIGRDYDQKDGHHFVVTDSGTGNVIKRFEGGVYAVSNGNIGFLFAGYFYRIIADNLFIGSSDINAVPITNDQFYADWHNRQTTQYPLMDAAEKLAKKEALAFMESLPTDLTQWDAEYDFPGVLPALTPCLAVGR